jgi:hypothetical protein
MALTKLCYIAYHMWKTKACTQDNIHDATNDLFVRKIMYEN